MNDRLCLSRPARVASTAAIAVTAALAFVAGSRAAAAVVTDPINVTLVPSTGLGGGSREHVVAVTVGGSLYELAVRVQKQTGLGPPTMYAKTVTWRTGTATTPGRTIEAVPLTVSGTEAEALTAGASVSLGSPFSSSATLLVRATGLGTTGAWSSGMPTALGLRFSDGSDSYFGYLLATISDLDNSNVGPTVVLDSISHESTPGVAIGVVPEPAAVWMLAAALPCATGLWRRGRRHPDRWPRPAGRAVARRISPRRGGSCA